MTLLKFSYLFHTQNSRSVILQLLNYAHRRRSSIALLKPTALPPSCRKKMCGLRVGVGVSGS